MSDAAVIFWTVMIFASVAWYAFLLFYVGFKGGVEIKEMTQTLSERNARNENPKK
jgi:hypothetical protein